MIRRKIIRVKGSLNRLLFLLECGHVRAMPTCTDRAKMDVGKLLRCRDCEERVRRGE